MEIDFSDKIKELFKSGALARPGPKSGAQTPAPESERRKGSEKNPKDSAGKGGGKISFSKKIIKSLQEKVKDHNEKYDKKVTLSQLKKVYRRGLGAFSVSHRPGQTRNSWAMARVNMFLKMARGGKVKDSYRSADQDVAKGEEVYYEQKSQGCFQEFDSLDLDVAQADLLKANVDLYSEGDIDLYDIDYSEAQKKSLGKPFRLPSGSRKKFGVYVKNEKGNTVVVKFGDPNMSIKRDNPARRKAFRSRHGCDNPGPRWKANYWSCKMWSATPVSEITSEEEMTLEADIQAQNKGLWYNIQQKKRRMGTNYRPAKPGSPGRPSQESLKKAQGSDYENENHEWDGETEFEQNELLKINASLSQAEEAEDNLKDYKEDFYGMIVGSISSIQQHAKNILDKLEDPMVKENLTEPFLQQTAALAEDYMVTIHNYVMFNKENQEIEASAMFKVGDKVKNINPQCDHYGSQGTVKQIKELPEGMGYAIVYECENEGMNYKKGDMLAKTEVQLIKAK